MQRHAHGPADADRLVRGSHARVAAGERLRDLDEVRDLGQAIAGDDEAQPVASFAERRRDALVGDRVIDAPARLPFLSLFDEGVTGSESTCQLEAAALSASRARRGWPRAPRRAHLLSAARRTRRAPRPA